MIASHSKVFCKLSLRRLVPCDVNGSRISEATLFRALEIPFTRGFAE